MPFDVSDWRSCVAKTLQVFQWIKSVWSSTYSFKILKESDRNSDLKLIVEISSRNPQK